MAGCDPDERVPAAFRPIGPEIEVASNGDWSISVSRSHDGFCISHAGSTGSRGITAGRLPQPGGRSQHIVAILGKPAARSGSVGFVTGLVMPSVARVQVELRDGTHISALTEAAPDALEADLRTFAIMTPFDGQPFGPNFPPLVREYVFLASDDAVLERLEAHRSTAHS
jgi:hypothetical protein